MKRAWADRCEHNFDLPGCEICNLYPTIEKWVNSPVFAELCRKFELGDARIADLIDATWTAGRAQLWERIRRVEQELRVERQQAQLRHAQGKES